MHNFEIFSRVVSNVDARIFVFIEQGAVVHEKFSDYVRTVESNLDVVHIVQRKIS